MFDKFIPTLSFAADPPEGGGGTKTKLSGSAFTADSTTEPVPVDPPESGGGGTETSSPSSDSSTSAE
jgi:hypothetical protein